ncbi:sialidase family protein [Brachyspira sp.]|uniref:sialidase family protein n=1 Tax=Brachyspira sp. TaxID=1977261 RepID=UPI00261A4863|nr:sialidase family protein [Brachyspira sp.]
MKKNFTKSFALVCALVFAISCSNKATTGPGGGGGKPNWFLTTEQQQSPWEIHQTLFDTKNGDVYRITGIVVSKKNTLIAVSDSRKSSESDVGFAGSGNIDIVLKRSEDGGKTWGEAITIPPKATSQSQAHGDPLIFSCNNGDLVVLAAAGGAWNQGVGGDSKVTMSRSTDDGLTWSEWKEVQDPIFKDSKMMEKGYNKGFAASGRGLTMKDGTLMGAMLVGDKGNSKKGAAIIVSTDNGNNWSVRGIAENNNQQDEPKVVAELDNGDILMSVRPNSAGARLWFTSSDKGVNWKVSTDTFLQDGRANAEGVRYTSVNSGHKKSRLLHINCNSTGRNTLTVVMSEDEGKSWDAAQKVIQSGNACYPSIDVLPDGTIVTYAEEPNVGQTGGGNYDMVFRRFNLSWLTDGKQVYDEKY